MTMEIDLSQFGLVRPEFVKWNFPKDVLSLGEPYLYIHDAEVRTKLKNYKAITEKNNLSWRFAKLPQDEFPAWVDYYTYHMEKLDYKVIASTKRLQDLIAEGFDVYSFDLYMKEQCIGRQLVKIRDGSAISSFRVNEHIKSPARNVSLGILFDYLLVVVLYEIENILSISFGHSKNCFGAAKTKIGYLRYKLLFGQLPEIPGTAAFLTSIPINNDGYSFFYTKNEGASELTLCAIKPSKYVEEYETIKKKYPNEIFEIEIN